MTLAVVRFGRKQHYKVNWLRFRHRSELFRLLRYEFLIQPSVWEGSESPENWIRTRIGAIEQLTNSEDLEKALNEPLRPGPMNRRTRA